MFKTHHLCFFLLISVVITFNSYAQSKFFKTPVDISKISITTLDKFQLNGHYYAGEQHSGGVLLLHGCNSDQKAYQDLITLLKKNNLHILSYDFRGYGESQSKRFSKEQLRKAADSILAYQTAMASLTSYWQSDALTAFEWLRKKVAKNKQIAIVSVGCASRYAVAIAEAMHVDSLIMVTPVMDHSDKEHYKNLADKPTYFISTMHQLESYKTAKELFEWNGSLRSKMQIFKGSYVDHALIKKQKGLIYDMARWLTNNLN